MINKLNIILNKNVENKDQLASMFSEVDKLKLDPHKYAFITYILIYRQLPNPTDLRDWEFDLKTFNLNDLSIDHFLEKINLVKVKFIDDSVLLVDVSHTINFSATSGVQRVVRRLSELWKNDDKVVFIRFDSIAKAYFRLNSSEVDTLIKPVVIESNVLISGSKNFFKKWTPKFLYAYLEPFWHAIRHILWILRADLKVKKQSMQSCEMIVPWGAIALMPEVVGTKSAIPYLKVIKKLSLCKFTLIFYDLIPILRPELCSVSEEYIHYLQLLTIVDQISCISDAAKGDLKRFLPTFLTDNNFPKITTHYLGFEDDKQSPAVSKISESKTILCVGSIDIRKNQLAVLKAAELVHKKNIPFKIIFAGNPGHEKDKFLRELVKYTERGLGVEFIIQPSDKELRLLYDTCRFTVFCSLAEGFGLPILESLRYGRPCLTSNFGSMKEIGEKLGGCEFASPEDIQQIADVMERLLLHDNIVESLQKNINIKDWPSWDAYAQKIFEYSKGIAT